MGHRHGLGERSWLRGWGRWAWPGQGDPCGKEEKSWERRVLAGAPGVKGLDWRIGVQRPSLGSQLAAEPWPMLFPSQVPFCSGNCARAQEGQTPWGGKTNLLKTVNSAVCRGSLDLLAQVHTRRCWGFSYSVSPSEKITFPQS